MAVRCPRLLTSSFEVFHPPQRFSSLNHSLAEMVRGGKKKSSMKAKNKSENWLLNRFNKQVAIGTIALLLLLPVATRGDGVVTTCTEANLRAAMSGGGLVTFACDGTITLAGTITITNDTTIDAVGHQISISGNNAVRIFSVETNVYFTVNNLTLANGRSESGAAILNAGTVRATDCVFSGNVASSLTNKVSSGGAVYNSGVLILSRCTLRENQAVGLRESSFPGHSHDSQGGAICNLGTLNIENSLFAWNQAICQDGGVGGSGGLTPGGAGGSGGSGYGGAIFNGGVATLVNSTLIANTCTGGQGGRGGDGGMYFTHGQYYYCCPGGPGGNGGSGLGSGIYSVDHLLNLTNCTIANNSAGAGVGGSGGIGLYGVAADGINGAASGALQSSVNSLLVNTVFATNSPPNGTGDRTDLGHNLSSDGSCAFTNVGSLNSTDPKLGPLADNGGSTLTMALLPGSPAIDAGESESAPFSDQRGFPRPVGRAADIGAYEFCYLPVLRATLAPVDIINVTLFTTNSLTCRLFTSPDLADWQCVATNEIGTNGTVMFQDNCGTGETQRFYRVAVP